jgi:RNA polymerase sigma-70 factor (ECF subfamily)
MGPRSEDAGAALAMLYETHRGALLAHLTRLVDDRGLAEDLCQDTFLKALCHWEQHAEIANMTAWLYRIATNTAYDQLRRRRRIVFASLGAGVRPFDDRVVESRLAEQEPVRQVLARLSPGARHLLLCIYAGHTTREVAAVLECSDAAVRLRLFRARRRFREIYAAIGAN